ncbi:hypothetical protein AB0K00_51610 [Dactylosporangium sp. NPDC049525]|uniref:hypothetical protein n=1 Tax=Dactylosporangium sp. NPDC049525 TaxID=3154730 RepID=UPI003432D673
MVNTDELPGAAEFVRELARNGTLKYHMSTGSQARRRWLRAGACEIVWPLVYARVTKRFEHSRGHFLCATAFHRLEPECLDRFHDDVEAVLDHLFANAGIPIQNLEGWLVMCLQRATVDGHRRRRSERGAAQRPRLTTWIRRALGDDPWLLELSVAILDWVGVESTAGSYVWPLTVWAQRRAVRLGDHRPDEAAVAADVETVLTAMRRKPAWYDRNIERPLGRKQAPVWKEWPAPDGTAADPEPLILVGVDEVNDMLMTELAAAALDTVRSRVRGGEPADRVVPEVIETVFGSPSATHGLDRLPGTRTDGLERAAELVRDPARRKRIVHAVLVLLREEAAR